MSKIVAESAKFNKLHLGKGMKLPETVQALMLFEIQRGGENKVITKHCSQLHARLVWLPVPHTHDSVKPMYEYQNWEYQWNREDQKFVRVPKEMLYFEPSAIFDLQVQQ